MTAPMQVHPGSGAPFRIVREVLGLTIVQVAEHAEVSPGYLSRIERGLARPSDGLSWLLSNVLAAASVRETCADLGHGTSNGQRTMTLPGTP